MIVGVSIKKIAGIIYHPSEVYNPKKVTTGTIPYDDPEINFNWDGLK